MSKLTIFVNDAAVYEYDKTTPLDARQRDYLDKMDADMSRGVKMQGELIVMPDSRQKARFVAMNLIKALQQNNEAAISASCAYLRDRIPGLLEVHANDHKDAVNIELIEEA